MLQINESIRDLSLFSLTNISIPTTITGVIVVGSSGVGKTTFVNSARESKPFEDRLLVIPKRYVTRPPRLNDDTTETTSIEKINFFKKRSKNFFSLYWKRCMELQREEWYGFSTYGNQFPLFSANNALLYPEAKVTVFPQQVMKNMLIIGICSDPDLIKKRLQNRSPDLFKNKQDEINYRLSDSSENIKKYAHIIVNNHFDSFSFHQQTISFFNRLPI